jgi:hypothetical protein
VLKRTLIAAAAALAAGTLFTVPASAEPGDNPCEFTINYVCKFIPIAPDLKRDVDLTKDQPLADPDAPQLDSLPVVDPCAGGCI